MRTIKFRGKQKNGNEWLYGYYFRYENTHSIVPDRYSSKPTEYFHVHPETVGQFTGLTDKNGKEIYEGDIVKAIYYNHNSPDAIFIQEVVFDKGGFFLKTLNAEIPSVEDYDLYRSFSGLYQFFNPTPNRIEIIGNIHDK